MLDSAVVSQRGTRYQLKDIAAHGGYGVIFLAFGPDGDKVAIKMQSYNSSMQEVTSALNIMAARTRGRVCIMLFCGRARKKELSR